MERSRWIIDIDVFLLKLTSDNATLLQGKLVGRQVTLDLFGDQKKSTEKKMLDLLLDLQHSKM